MFNRALIVFLLVFQTEALADARPITYNITMDYNSVTNQFENAKVTGSSTVQISTSGYWPIQISMQKDGVAGLIPSEAGGGNHQIAIQRSYSDFNFTLRNVVEEGLSIPVVGFLNLSEINHSFSSLIRSGWSNNCAEVDFTQTRIWIRAVNGAGCNGKTHDMTPSDSNQPISLSSMSFGFDLHDQIRRHLSQPNYKAGDYVGSIVYTGDSIISRVGGRMTESYTFNFVVTKKKQLVGFDFPNGMVTNFEVNKYGSDYVGTAALHFNIDGVFNVSDKLRFTFNSANSRQGKLNLKHVSADKFIPYNVELVDLKVGRPILFNAQNESKLISNTSDNKLNGKFNFNFRTNANDIVSGDYSDRLTIMVALDI